uniref:tRNA pseudouridine synthase Pus10 n=1 Tax=Ignisphaera aggregans TaxID=334771 RepID=A0A7C2ZM62_9CREN
MKRERIVESDKILDKAIEILKSYPLCDRCMGRLFGYLGKGMSNLERGRALKTVVVLEVHRRLQLKELDAETAKTILLNAQRAEDAKSIGLDVDLVEHRPCHICGDMVEKWIEDYANRIASKISGMGIRTFIVGITSAQEYVSREEAIAREFDLRYRESIKRELKREIGKKVSMLSGATPDFEEPEVTFVIDLSKGDISLSYPSTILYGFYWKYGRMISQNIWITKRGERKYPLAIEDVVRYVCERLNINGYQLHIAGREDVDVRVLGSGRPIAIEFKTLGRSIDLDHVESILNSYTPLLQFRMVMRVNRGFVARIKEGARFSRKIYRAIVYVSSPIPRERLETLEQEFKDRVIEQRTPLRVLKRKKDSIRKRKVYRVKVVQLSPQLFEALINCDGGLYVKELISGDNGRTRPSFSDVLGCEARCLMLDVLYVHEYI